MKTSLVVAGLGACLALVGCGTDPAAGRAPSTAPSTSSSDSPTPSASPSASSASPSASSASPSDSPSGSPSPSGWTSGSPTPQASESGQAAVNGTVIMFPSPGITLTSTDEIRGTVGVSPQLQQFLGSELERIRRDSPGCGSASINLEGVRVPDLASGGLNGCGSDRAVLWARVNGQWKVAVEGQTPPQCSAVRSAGVRTTVPRGFYGADCDDNGKVVTYQP